MTTADIAPMSHQLRAAMAEFATGVTVVTTVDGEGVRKGSTANAVTSLSLDPPLLTVYFAETSTTLRAVEDSGVFAVNILAADQADLASSFAVKDDSSAWEGCEVSDLSNGPPLIDGCAAWLVCELEDCLAGGDHRILVGRVIATLQREDECEPLIFHRGGFR